jgi:hypothetical protein
VEVVLDVGLIDPTTADVVVPTMVRLLSYEGASNVHLEGVNITHTGASYMQPYQVGRGAVNRKVVLDLPDLPGE